VHKKSKASTYLYVVLEEGRVTGSLQFANIWDYGKFVCEYHTSQGIAFISRSFKVGPGVDFSITRQENRLLIELDQWFGKPLADRKAYIALYKHSNAPVWSYVQYCYISYDPRQNTYAPLWLTVPSAVSHRCEVRLCVCTGGFFFSSTHVLQKRLVPPLWH